MYFTCQKLSKFSKTCIGPPGKHYANMTENDFHICRHVIIGRQHSNADARYSYSSSVCPSPSSILNGFTIIILPSAYGSRIITVRPVINIFAKYCQGQQCILTGYKNRHFQTSCFISEMIQDRAILTTERH